MPQTEELQVGLEASAGVTDEPPAPLYIAVQSPQSAIDIEPGLFVPFPAGQDVQELAPHQEYFPARQVLHLVAVLLPVSVLYFPAAQFVQLEEPLDDAYFPAAQFVQLEEPLDDAYFPAAQDVQLEEPLDDAYFPAAQFVQLEEPVDDAYFPAAQAVHFESKKLE